MRIFCVYFAYIFHLQSTFGQFVLLDEPSSRNIYLSTNFFWRLKNIYAKIYAF